ncbi:MAG: lysozyme [Desulfovibrio sp.]|nr:lysozyme [Desulfovibrio sp.]
MNANSLAQQLLVDEGFVPHAYRDSLGYWTIGVGRLIDERKRGGITRDEALVLLGNDIRRHWAELTGALPWVDAAPEAVQEVLANMCFNLGLAGLLKFRQTLAHLEAGRYPEAAEEMLRSQWAEQVGARAGRLAQRLRVLPARS